MPTGGAWDGVLGLLVGTASVHYFPFLKRQDAFECWTSIVGERAAGWARQLELRYGGLSYLAIGPAVVMHHKT